MPDALGVLSRSDNLEGGVNIVTLRGVLLPDLWTTAALHLDSTCRASLDTVASLFIVAFLRITFAV